MTISVWRYSHLALAVSSFLFLALASITGIILAVEPIIQKTQPYRVGAVNELTVAETLPVLKKNYAEISELSLDANQFLQLKGSDADGENLTIYVDPQTGKQLGIPGKQSEFFQWVTALHRSLFLHETGRFFIGLTAFLLLLSTLSGIVLIIQRQRGLKRFFGKIVRDNFAQYYHVVLGRLSFLPIIIIALSGTYLSLARFGLVETKIAAASVDLDAIRAQPQRQLADFAVFKSIRLSEVQSIEFPFSEDPEDYFTLKLKDRELTVNQITGDILSENKYPVAVLLTELSLDLHTGRASAWWAIVLAVAAGNILFFIYSGFAITWKRRANRITNKYTADESQFIILVGSENGTTFRFAQLIHQQLLKRGQKSFLTECNKYAVFPKAEHLLVLTATYGLGEAPTNATRFTDLITKFPQQQPVRYSVLGFGSRAYPDFCQFAFEINQLLAKQSWATPLIDIHTINDRSPDEFSLWATAWTQQADQPLFALSDLEKTPTVRFSKLTVTHNTGTEQPEGTFLMRLQSPRRLGITSGDLLAIYPANDHRERLYSIGVLEKEIQLSVRLHAGGLGSGFLHQLTPGETIRARIVRNDHFHFPKKAPVVVMIANGTGIAPFLGMISQNKQQIPCHLYCGFRQATSLAIYRDFLEESQANKKLSNLHVAYSREGNKQYVSELLARDADFMAQTLTEGGIVMICGSLAMQKDVIDQLDLICQAKNGQTVSHYQAHNQIRMDCY
ncbi:PepSY domain-containing protein [Fibrella aquatica]|uniref:PepSY domain-containing protein n=1 Tax=Fibrella aquatica TaxID=3242487 RepID=UPI0035207557